MRRRSQTIESRINEEKLSEAGKLVGLMDWQQNSSGDISQNCNSNSQGELKSFEIFRARVIEILSR